MLPESEVDPLHEGRVDLPTQGGQHLIDSVQRAEHHAVLHGDQARGSHGLDHLRSANNSSSWTWLMCISWRKWRENARRCSAASTSHCSTVLGSTSNTRAVPRIPSPSA